jgi:hypothetical protein
MTLGVSSGGTVHGDYGFSDDEAEEVTLVVDSTEDDLEGARQAEDGISICLKRRQHNLRSRWLV